MNISLKVVLAISLLSLSSLLRAESADWWVDITNDRVEQVRSQLAVGEDPNAVSKKGQPALMQAIQDGAWKVFDLLVRHRNIDVNVVNANDETPLMYLSVIGETKRASDLIKKGAQVNRLGWTPLHYAASKGHLDTVNLLLANEAIVNAPSPDGTSPLMMAAYAGSDDVVRVLLAAGADPTARNLRGEDAAVWAQRKNHGQLAAQLNNLTKRVLDSRASASGNAASRTNSGAPGVGAPGEVYTLDVARPPVPDAVGRAADATPQASSGSDTSGSASRYFDLDRFERDDNGY